MSFRKKHKEARGDMKVAHATGSKGAERAAAAEQDEAQTQQMPAETPAEAATQEELAATSEDKVPDGTTAEILAWVGDDKDRAQRALDKENADEKPRVGLTGELEKKLDE